MLFTVFRDSFFCFSSFFFIRTLSRSLCSLVRFFDAKKQMCVNTVRAHFPWSDFCILDTYTEKPFNILTNYNHFKYLANCFIFILSFTTVCSRSTSVDIWKIISEPLRQCFTIGTIIQHSGQGDIWCWFTSSFTKQRRVWSFTHSLVTTYMS